MKDCPKCGTAHEKNGVYCSRKCANSRVQTTEQNAARRSKLAGKPGHNVNKGKKLVSRMVASCGHCGLEFEKTEKSGRKFCSLACSKKVAGGYRDGSGRAKSGYYKGVYCGSTYELAWVIYQLDHNTQFERFPKTLEHEGRKYIPDFLQDGKIVELKGYESEERVAAKTAIANQCGYQVTVLRKQDLVAEFKWVKENYQFSNMHELYDDYSPAYSYSCCACGVTYQSDVKKTGTNFCSASCSLSENRKRKKHGPVKRGNLEKEVVLKIFNDTDGSLSQIAERYGTSKNMVFFIKTKKSYSWVHE